ncbi:hypothetical protein EST38_g249 [Candolleomyces aberdarensis]|uniref:NADP-dependent oxidoreductase domain-containing protein n=1 Tax=Candolleomyces aberdarensis TaxID=2316362 RepID=A0A4V1Q5H6_9AGAR|nr:hypothetical protein EST38_g249 [Candolleomyces aberdarensis]
MLSLTDAVRLSSGHSMPILGFGVYQNYTTKESVLEAFRAGYRQVDSAQAYKNEAHVGEAFRESGLERKDVFINYIDLFLIHNPHSGTEKRLETYKALLEAKEAGKIKSVGVSNYGIHHLEEIEQAGLERPSVNQIELHPFCQQRPIVEYCKARGLVIQAYCPIIRGQLDHPLFTELAAKYQRDPAQVLLRWSLQKGFVPLPKSANPSRIHSNTSLFDFELSPEDMEKLDSLDKGKEGCITWNPVDAP